MAHATMQPDDQSSICFTIDEAARRLNDDRYIIEACIGVGGMACVYRARERSGPHHYAIKMLRAEFVHDSRLLDIFRREALVMHNFQHPNIVRFYRYVENAHSPYIRMDYIDGHSLSDWLHYARQHQIHFMLDDVMRLAAQAGAAVGYLHREGQLHLDIKPGNILIRRADGRVFLTDLGVTMEEGDRRSFIAGTPYYMPYEQQAGQALDHSADTYALAVVLYEMLTGHRPFEIDNTTDRRADRERLKLMHRDQPAPPVSRFRADLPPALDAVMQRALAKLPHQRFESIAAFIEAFHAALRPDLSPALYELAAIEPAPLKARTPDESSVASGVAPAQRRAHSRSRLLVSAALASLLLIIGTVIIVMLQNTGDAVRAEETTSAAVSINQQSPTIVSTKTPEPPVEAATVELPPASGLTAPSSTPERPTEAAIIQPPVIESVVSSPTPPAAVEMTDPAAVTPPVTVTADSSPIPTETPTSTPTDTPTSTPTATVTHTPTLTVTPSPTPTPTATLTPSPVPTAFLSSIPLLYILQGADTIGLTDNLDDSITLLHDEHQHWIPLRLGHVNGFQVAFDLASQPNQLLEYGVAFRVQDASNHWLFLIETNNHAWALYEVRDSVRRLAAGAALTGPLPQSVRVSGLDAYFRLEFDDTYVQQELNGWASGGAALWLLPSGTAGAQLDNIRLGLLGDEAVAASQNAPALAPPQVRLTDFLLADLRSLRAAADNNANIDCSVFVPVYKSIDRHLNRPETTLLAQEALRINSLIHTQCQLAGSNGLLNFNDRYSDLLRWEEEISQLIHKL